MSSDRIHNEHCRPQSIGSKKITPRFSSSGSRNVVQFHTFCTKKQVLLISLLTVLFCLVHSGMQYQTSVGHDMAHIYSMGCRILSRAAEFVLGRGIFKFLRNIINDG